MSLQNNAAASLPSQDSIVATQLRMRLHQETGPVQVIRTRPNLDATPGTQTRIHPLHGNTHYMLWASCTRARSLDGVAAVHEVVAVHDAAGERDGRPGWDGLSVCLLVATPLGLETTLMI